MRNTVLIFIMHGKRGPSYLLREVDGFIFPRCIHFLFSSKTPNKKEIVKMREILNRKGQPIFDGQPANR